MICPTCKGAGVIEEAKPKAKRITHAQPGGWFSPEYSSVSAFNSDNSRILLQAVDRFVMFDGNGNPLGDVFVPGNTRGTVSLLGASQEPRWSSVSPHWFYFIRGNQLWAHNILEPERHSFLIQEFRQYSEITGAGESDTSDDNGHLVLTGDRKDVFVFNAHTRQVETRFVPGFKFDGLKITHDNRIVISSERGIAIYDSKRDVLRNLTTANGHADIAHWKGRDVLIWTNSADKKPSSPDAIVRIDMESGEELPIFSVTPPWTYSVNISAPYERDFVIVSTYNATGGHILKVRLDGSGFEMLGPHGSLATDYTAQPRAVVSRDGTKLVYGSNMGGPNVDCFLIEI